MYFVKKCCIDETFVLYCPHKGKFYLESEGQITMSATLGSVVHNEREAAHLTQRELARMIKVSNSTISRIESDDGIHPDPPTLKAISDVLKVDYNYLLALNGQIADDPDIRMIQRGAKNLSPDDRKRMMKTLNAMFDDLFTEQKSGGDTSS